MNECIIHISITITSFFSGTPDGNVASEHCYIIVMIQLIIEILLIENKENER